MSYLADIRRGLARTHPRSMTLSPLPPAAMASGAVPTMTWSAANAATSAISGATRRVATDPYFNYYGAEMVAVDSSLTGGVGGFVASRDMTTTAQVARGIVEFSTDGDRFELYFQCRSTSNLRFRLFVDGAPTDWAPSAGFGSGNALYRLLVDFTSVGGRAIRRIRVEWQQGRFGGVVAHPTTSVWRTGRDPGPTILVLGDSFAEGTGAAWWWDSWAATACRIIGANPLILAVGSTGYLAAPAGKAKYRDRLATDAPTGGVDMVWPTGGYNDNGTDVTAEATALHAAIAAAYPNALTVQFGPWWPAGVTASGLATTLRDQLAAAMAASNAARPGSVAGLIDPVVYPAAGASWITGTGKAGATNSTGNADFYTGSDGVHPTAAGHEYLGRRVAAELIRLGLA